MGGSVSPNTRAQQCTAAGGASWSGGSAPHRNDLPVQQRVAQEVWATVTVEVPTVLDRRASHACVSSALRSESASSSTVRNCDRNHRPFTRELKGYQKLCPRLAHAYYPVEAAVAFPYTYVAFTLFPSPTTTEPVVSFATPPSSPPHSGLRSHKVYRTKSHSEVKKRWDDSNPKKNGTSTKPQRLWCPNVFSYLTSTYPIMKASYSIT